MVCVVMECSRYKKKYIYNIEMNLKTFSVDDGRT